MKIAPCLWLAGSLSGVFAGFGPPRYNPVTVARQRFEKNRLAPEFQAKAAVTDTQTYAGFTHKTR